MQGPSPDSSHTDKIQAALDEMVARRRRERGASIPPGAAVPSPVALPAERRPIARWSLIGLLAVTVHAAGIYWYVQDKPTRPGTIIALESAPAPSSVETGALAASEPKSPDAETASTHDPAPATEPGPDANTRVVRTRGPGQAGVIKYNGETIIVPVSRAPSVPPPVRASLAATATAPAPRTAKAVADEPVRLSPQAHAEAAKDFAYYHFRYKYKVGSANYAITSQSLRITSTDEIASWSRYRSSGEVGLEYYDNSGFRRTTRRFEVLTEEKNGDVRALEITVK